MVLKTTHSRSSWITRSLLRLCVWLIILSTTPVAAQSTNEAPSSAPVTTIVQPFESVSQQTTITTTKVTTDVTTTEASPAFTTAEIPPAADVDIVGEPATNEIESILAVMSATETPTPPALEEPASADASALDATPRPPTATRTPTKTPTPSPTPFFLPAPVITGPDNGVSASSSSHPPLGIPSFSWAEVESADFYEVQVSAGPGFSTLLPDGKAVTTYANSYTLVKSLADGEYYWRVRACGGKLKECFDYSETRMFKKDWNNAGSVVPQLLSPPQNSVRITLTAEDFSWTPVIGAAKYKFELSGDPGFGTSSIAYEAETIKPHHVPSPKTITEYLENRIYYWRVTPIDNQGNYGVPSVNGKFELKWNLAPQLFSPANKVDLQFAPRFQWTAVEGARTYYLQVASDDRMSNQIAYAKVANSEYTFTENLSNDQEYCWRVKAIDYWGKEGNWSEIRCFRMKWNFQPKLLAIPNDGNNPATQQGYFFLNWSPAPSAEKYQVQVDEGTGYNLPLMDITFHNVNNATLVKNKDRLILLDHDYYWRVRGIDARGNFTPWSEELPLFQRPLFQMGAREISTQLIYPPYYFQPDSANMPQYRDGTVSWPVFVWDTAFECRSGIDNCPTLRPDYYELTVYSDISLTTVNFKIQTRGIAVAPTLTDSFSDLQDGKVYYWRVRAFRAGQPVGQDNLYPFRIDRRVNRVALSNQVTLMYPRDAYEAVDEPPVLGWQPVNNAVNYHVQLSRDKDFTKIIEEQEPQFINYVPWQARMGETPTGFEQMPFGTYYWRVRAKLNSGAFSSWSEIRSFNLSRFLIMGNWYDVRPPGVGMSMLKPFATNALLGELEDTLIITNTRSAQIYYDPELTFATGSTNQSNGEYEIGRVHAMLNRVDLDLSNTSTIIPASEGSMGFLVGFEVAPTISQMIEYGIYVDIDHVAGSGATFDPQGNQITGDSRYLPEYALYVERSPSQGVDETKVYYYSWSTTEKVWLPNYAIERRPLSDLDGRAWLYEGGIGEMDVLHISIPYEKIGSTDLRASGSVALSIFSVEPNSRGIVDTAPEENLGMDNPLFLSDMLQVLWPFDTPLSNPIVEFDMPPLRWHAPYFTSVDGYQTQFASDAKFTDIVDTWEFEESSISSYSSWLPASYQSPKPFGDNESYYMRVRTRYERFGRRSTFDYGAWSPAVRIKLSSRKATNLRLSTGNVAWMTPTFMWDRVDGATGYTLQVDNDLNFANPEIAIDVDPIHYTPLKGLTDGTYYWRVISRRTKTIMGEPSQVMSFTYKMITPSPISPINDEVLTGLPTFQWNIVLTPTTTPRFAASRYKIELSDDPGFSRPMLFYSESSSFTPDAKVALPAGTWYWRVGIVDPDNNEGAMSPVQQFKREYETLDLLSPEQGSKFSLAPEFEWQPILGASYYELWIDTDPGFASPIKILTDNSRYTPTANLDSGENFWKVRMVDERGVPGPFEQGSFRVEGGVAYLPIVIK